MVHQLNSVHIFFTINLNKMLADYAVAIAGLMAIAGTAYCGFLYASHPDANDDAYYTAWGATSKCVMRVEVERTVGLFSKGSPRLLYFASLPLSACLHANCGHPFVFLHLPL